MSNTDLSGVDVDFAQRVRERREFLGLTQGQLAEAMKSRGYDFHQQTIYKIESGNRKVTVGEGSALAFSLGVPMEQLTGDFDLSRELANVDAYRHNLETAVHEYVRSLAVAAWKADDLDELRAGDGRVLMRLLSTYTPAAVGARAKDYLDELQKRSATKDSAPDSVWNTLRAMIDEDARRLPDDAERRELMRNLGGN